jgi:hypothetical protein
VRSAVGRQTKKRKIENKKGRKTKILSYVDTKRSLGKNIRKRTTRRGKTFRLFPFSFFFHVDRSKKFSGNPLQGSESLNQQDLELTCPNYSLTGIPRRVRDQNALYVLTLFRSLCCNSKQEGAEQSLSSFFVTFSSVLSLSLHQGQILFIFTLSWLIYSWNFFLVVRFRSSN